MIFRCLGICFLTSLLAAVPALAAKHKHIAEAQSSYKGAIVIDANTGNVLIQDSADVVNPPASVTKLMTFLIVSDRIRSGNLTLQTPVHVTAEDAKIGGTQVWLKEGETFTVDELLYALMIQSANDAANALARTAAGSRTAFVEMMNQRAAQLGMENTVFKSPHGLPPSGRKLSDSDLSTPRDLALLSRELILHTDILRYTSVKQRVFRPNSAHQVVMNNHNHLLGKVAGVDGLKTGFTNGAGFCLAATAQRNGRRIIAVAVGSPDRKVRDLEVAELIERGFAALPAGPAVNTPAAATQSPPASNNLPFPDSPVSPISAPAAGTSGVTPTPTPAPPTVSFPSVKRK